MNKYFSILAASVLITGCSGSKDPVEIVKGPADTIIEMHSKMCAAKSFQPMVEYATPETQNLVAALAKNSLDPAVAAATKAAFDIECKIKLGVVKEEMNGDTATVELSRDGKATGKPGTMKKIEGKWKIIAS